MLCVIFSWFHLNQGCFPIFFQKLWLFPSGEALFPLSLSLSLFLVFCLLHFTGSYQGCLTLRLSGQPSNCLCKWKVRCPIHIPAKVIIRELLWLWLATAGVWERGTQGKWGWGGDRSGREYDRNPDFDVFRGLGLLCPLPEQV